MGQVLCRKLQHVVSDWLVDPLWTIGCSSDNMSSTERRADKTAISVPMFSKVHCLSTFSNISKMQSQLHVQLLFHIWRLQIRGTKVFTKDGHHTCIHLSYLPFQTHLWNQMANVLSSWFVALILYYNPRLTWTLLNASHIFMGWTLKSWFFDNWLSRRHYACTKCSG